MRISDWSSDVCSSDLKAAALQSRLTRGGLTSSLELLDAQRSLASAEAALAVFNATIAADRVRLFLALGGGWETPSARSEERRVGKAWGRACRSRWSPDQSKTKSDQSLIPHL